MPWGERALTPGHPSPNTVARALRGSSQQPTLPVCSCSAWLSEGALRRTLERLRGWKYECFWQGNFGHLARASGGSWCAEFEFKRWSNLVCAHEPAVLAALGALAI